MKLFTRNFSLVENINSTECDFDFDLSPTQRPHRPRLRFNDFWIKSNLFCNENKCENFGEWENDANWTFGGNSFHLGFVCAAVEISRTSTNHWSSTIASNEKYSNYSLSFCARMWRISRNRLPWPPSLSIRINSCPNLYSSNFLLSSPRCLYLIVERCYFRCRISYGFRREITRFRLESL